MAAGSFGPGFWRVLETLGLPGVTAGSVIEVRYTDDSVVLVEAGAGEVATARFEETVMQPIGNRVSLSDPARDFSLLLEPVEPPADWASTPIPPTRDTGMKICPQCAEGQGRGLDLPLLPLRVRPFAAARSARKLGATSSRHQARHRSPGSRLVSRTQRTPGPERGTRTAPPRIRAAEVPGGLMELGGFRCLPVCSAGVRRHRRISRKYYLHGSKRPADGRVTSAEQRGGLRQFSGPSYISGRRSTCSGAGLTARSGVKRYSTDCWRSSRMSDGRTWSWRSWPATFAQTRSRKHSGWRAGWMG
jgi:hypothetical protein